MHKPAPAAQTRELRIIWDDLVSLFPRLRATLPADLAKAKARLHELDGKSFGDHHIYTFYRIGALIDRHPAPMTMHELSDALGVPLSTATHIVDSLVESGYVKRVPDSADRRIVRVALTPTGAKLYATFNDFFNRHVKEFLSRFTQEERENMIALMQKAVDVLREITN